MTKKHIFRRRQRHQSYTLPGDDTGHGEVFPSTTVAIERLDRKFVIKEQRERRSEAKGKEVQRPTESLVRVFSNGGEDNTR